MSYYRVGNKNPRNLYLVGDDGTEVHVGCMFDPLDGPRTVRALNMLKAHLAVTEAAMDDNEEPR